jgi:hypothetical protein
MAAVKFSFAVITYDGGYNYYDMTEDEMSSKCCIYEAGMYFYDSIPEDERCNIDVGFPSLYDVMNYETTAWWDWPEKQLLALQSNEKIPERLKKEIGELLTMPY